MVSVLEAQLNRLEAGTSPVSKYFYPKWNEHLQSLILKVKPNEMSHIHNLMKRLEILKQGIR